MNPAFNRGTAVIRCLASGSKGNSYAIDDGETVLLLEAGIPAHKIMSGYLDLLSRVAGCLITHEHQDHASGAADLAARGIDLYMSAGTLEAIQKQPVAHRVNRIENGRQFQIGSWTVLPFDVEHDAAEPLGFLLYSNKTCEKVLFATDTYYIKYRFTGLTALMVECNYSLQIMLHNAEQGLIMDVHKNRLLKSHFSLENLCDFLQHTDLSMVHDIYLLHLSSDNGSGNFVKTIEALTGIPTTTL